jgi:hypothetical protein
LSAREDDEPNRAEIEREKYKNLAHDLEPPPSGLAANNLDGLTLRDGVHDG